MQILRHEAEQLGSLVTVEWPEEEGGYPEYSCAAGLSLVVFVDGAPAGLVRQGFPPRKRRDSWAQQGRQVLVELVTFSRDHKELRFRFGQPRQPGIRLRLVLGLAHPFLFARQVRQNGGRCDEATVRRVLFPRLKTVFDTGQAEQNDLIERLRQEAGVALSEYGLEVLHLDLESEVGGDG